MNTIRSYFQDTYQFSNQATITMAEQDELGHYLVLDQAIFYPQGGGQPADKGIITADNKTITVNQVKAFNEEVRHYTDQNCEALIGKIATCEIDGVLRLQHARLHSGGHLISNVVEKLYPGWRAIKGHHFPGQSYVKFNPTNKHIANIDIQMISQALLQAIANDNRIEIFEIRAEKLADYCPNLQYSIPNNDIIRIVGIDQFPYQPCGGTHIKSLHELQGLQIIAYKIKKNILKIKYKIET